MITQRLLKDVLHYDIKTGVFTWVKQIGNRCQVGQVAGGFTDNGYIMIQLYGTPYRAHRLAWLYVHGYLPENDLDHIDRDKKNNCISNLREVSRQCDSRNSCVGRRNKSGVKGVCYIRRDDKHGAQIGINGTTINLGQYSSFDEAVCARLAAEQAVNWHGCDSSSSAYKYVRDNIQRR